MSRREVVEGWPEGWAYAVISECPGYRVRTDGSLWSCWEAGGRGKAANQTGRWHIRDKQQHGRQPRGEQIHTAKLNRDDVRTIRRIGPPLKPLARRFGVTEALISAVLKRKVWKHVA